jgi:TrmH family RNA methyltransferase
VFRVPIFEGPSIKELGRAASPIITLSSGGEDIRKCRFPESFCLLPGLEGQGLPSELYHLKSLSIPMERGVESLNAALATGIALYAWRCQSPKE